MALADKSGEFFFVKSQLSFLDFRHLIFFLRHHVYSMDRQVKYSRNHLVCFENPSFLQEAMQILKRSQGIIDSESKIIKTILNKL